jgi:hypothetical protein
MNVSRRRSGYWQMVAEWRAIFDRPISDEDKREACLSVLRGYVNRKALARFRQHNASLRFYADMLVLRTNLNPMFAADAFGFEVIWPMYWLIDDWVRANTEKRAPARASASEF